MSGSGQTRVCAVPIILDLHAFLLNPHLTSNDSRKGPNVTEPVNGAAAEQSREPTSPQEVDIPPGTPAVGAFVEDILYGVWICEPGGGLQYASRSFLDLLGMTLDEASGFGWAERLIPEDNDSLTRWHACVAQECDWDDEHRIRGQDGKERTLLARGHAVRGKDGAISGWVGLHLDITDRKRNAERIAVLRSAQARQQERERIAQRLHDHLQQSLFAAELQVQSLSNVISDKELTKTLDLIKQARKLSRDLSVELHPPVLYEQGLAAAIHWLANHMQEAHGLRVEYVATNGDEVQDRELKTLLFDSIRELLFNVVKHAGVDEAIVRGGMLGPDELWFAVGDEGVGFRVSNSNRSGFGLAGVRHRIESLGGSFAVESSPGDGTTITLTVPVNPS